MDQAYWFLSNFTSAFFKLILRIDIFSTSYAIELRWMTGHPIDDKSTLSGDGLVPSDNQPFPEQQAITGASVNTDLSWLDIKKFMAQCKTALTPVH